MLFKLSDLRWTQYMADQIVRLHLPGSGDQVLSGKHSLQTEFKIFTND